MFLEKAKLKDDSSNDAEWVRNPRIILIAAQKNYVVDAPLGERPAAGADADVLNVWQARSDDYSIVQCAMLYGLEPGLQRHFEYVFTDRTILLHLADIELVGDFISLNTGICLKY